MYVGCKLPDAGQWMFFPHQSFGCLMFSTAQRLVQEMAFHLRGPIQPGAHRIFTPFSCSHTSRGWPPCLEVPGQMLRHEKLQPLLHSEISMTNRLGRLWLMVVQTLPFLTRLQLGPREISNVEGCLKKQRKGESHP